MKNLYIFLISLFLLIPTTGYCELYGVHSALKEGLTFAVPIHSNEFLKVYVTQDTIDTAICWTGYPENGIFFMRVYYECKNEKCTEFMAENFAKNEVDGVIHRWSKIDPKYLKFWASDSVFDLRSEKISTKSEYYFDKWGYIMGNVSRPQAVEEELNEKFAFSYAIATKIDNILNRLLLEAKENPHSCLNTGERRPIGR